MGEAPRIAREVNQHDEPIMKTITTKELISLVGILIAAPVLALAILVSARVAAVAENDLLLLAVALCGAVVSGINGFGRRTTKTQNHSGSSRKAPPAAALRS